MKRAMFSSILSTLFIHSSGHIWCQNTTNVSQRAFFVSRTEFPR